MKAYEKFLYKLGLVRVKRFKNFISSILVSAAAIHSEDMNEIRKLKVDNAIWRAEANKAIEANKELTLTEKDTPKKRAKKSK